ncbi:MAG: zinc-binding dehydrogenase [Saprospiraceae bacterium]|nr:zinc-binding dehydrogenase [Saprospiraceae bacterium]
MERQVYRLKAGSIDRLSISRETLPEPGPQEVTVAVQAIGLNFADIFAVWGLYSATPEGPFVPGLEYAGEILRVGSAVSAWKPGDRIMGVTRFGAYATHLNIDSRYVVRLPGEWTFDTGAAYLVQVLTAYYGLRYLGNLEEGQTVLIHSAAGGVGILANRIAKKYGAFTIGTVGSQAKVDWCQSEGYDRVIVRSRDFEKKLLEALGDRPLQLIMECIGGKILQTSYDHLAPEGRMVVFGSARYTSQSDRPNYPRLLWQFLTRPRIDPQEMTNRNVSVLGFNLIYLYEKADLMHRLLQELEALELPPPHVGHTFSFADLPDAIRLFRTGETVGKVVVRTG